MSFDYKNLDKSTRKLMIQEIESAIKEDNLYYSTRFTDKGIEIWGSLLLQAAREHNELWLAYELESNGCMKGLEGSRTPKGGYTIKYVPHNASETIAEGQFNRYYMLGLCLRAIDEGVSEVTIYRAKHGRSQRGSSHHIIGQKRIPEEIVNSLRPVNLSLKHELTKPNSGISLHL